MTEHQAELLAGWEEHMRAEFEAHDVDATMKTMNTDPHLINIPTLTGGVGIEEVRFFYTNYFVTQLPDDTETELVSRTIGDTQIVDELVFKFTHSISMPWILPNIEPTHKRVEIPLVVIIGFDGTQVCHEHIFWDQASVLVQVGLLEKGNLPINGIEAAQKLLNPNALPSNQLVK